MEIGKLRHRVEIQRKEVQTDELLQQTEVWATYATVWASVRPIKGREYIAVKQVNAEISVVITMRYVSGITPEMRVLFGSRVFEIVSVINVDERNRVLELMCKEVVADDV